MSNSVFPTSLLRGITFSSFKTPTGARRIQRSVSGRETVMQDYANPIWLFRVPFSFLRDYPSLLADSELKLLLNFWVSMVFSGDTFLYEDRDDNTVVGGFIGTGDGAMTEFQLAREIIVAGFHEDIIAPNVVSNIYVNGVDPGGWTVDSDTGIVTMGSAPADGATITADFTFYFRCRFIDDAVDFERFMHQLWTVKELRFRSVLL